MPPNITVVDVLGLKAGSAEVQGKSLQGLTVVPLPEEDRARLRGLDYLD